MNGLDPRFILAYTFGKYFSDKTTGQPLSGGYILFFEDEARTVPKDVYILSGGPTNYIYTNIGPRVEISASGMPIYQNDNIAIYFFPYQGIPATSNGIVQLYFYEVFDAGGNPQFNREAQPNNVDGSIIINGTVTKNFAPNGQMLLHYDLPATDISPIYRVGEIRLQPGPNPGITPLAYGGWTFQRDASSTSDDFAIFDISTFDGITDAFPRFNVTLRCTSPDASDLLKDWTVTFDDVNKFSSATQMWTYNFTGISNTGGNVTVQLFLIKNYGTDGSPETSNLLTTFTLTPTETQFNYSFVFGLNNGMTIDDVNNNDFVALALRRSTSAISDVTIGNFILGEGTIPAPIIFPATTTREFIYESIMPVVPDYNGFDLYLPRVLTMDGEKYDDGEIGRVVNESQISVYDETTGFHPTTNLLIAKGIQYETISYSPLGIPMARLQRKYFDPNINTPIHGTGTSYFTGYYKGSGNELILTNNSGGLVTATADGAIPTNFAFANIHLGSTSYFVRSYITTGGGDTFWIEDTNVGQPNAPDPKNSGFTIVGIQAGNNVGLLNIISVNVPALPLANTRFWFSSVDNLFAPVDYYVWFKIDGVGTDPADAGRTGILVNLSATDTVITAAEKIREALNAWQNSSIKMTAANTITGGSYFEATSITPLGATQLYVIWYEVNSVGTQPVVGGTPLYIKVTLTGAETNAQVVTATQIAINSKYFSTPDYRNSFLRIWNDGLVSEEQLEGRSSLVPGIYMDRIGTFQLSDNLDHRHTLDVEADAYASITSVDNGNPFFQGGAGGQFYAIDGTGFILDPLPTDPDLFHFESRPPNQFVNAAIKY